METGKQKIQNCWRLLVLSQIIFISACFNEQPKQTQTPETQPIEVVSVPNSVVKLADKLEISKLAEDVAVQNKISQTIDSSEFRNARWGIIAISLKDGRIVAANDAQKLFNPASIQKMLTSMVALDKLGGGFRWKTQILAEQSIANGTLDGDLILYGQGSPDFDDEALQNLVNQLQTKGLKRVKGKIIGDESYFKGDKIGDGWTWNELQWYYGAEASALTFNENQTNLSLQNGKPKVSDNFVTAKGEVKSVQDIEAVGVKRELGENEVYVWGNANALDVRISVSKSALRAAKKLKEKLEKAGITVEGEAVESDWKDGANREKFSELAKVESKTLAEIVRKMNKDSVNLFAELILRTLGKKFGNEAPDENPKFQKLRGDDSAGASVVAKWLKDNKSADDETKIHDGSGLSRLDFISPETFGRALVFANQAKFAETFKNSLPIAGVDGTLRGRLRGEKVAAKTGSMTYINSIAGYANSSKGESYAFVVILNNETRKAESTETIDAIVKSLLR
jgi:serine-type D-Ala-D-Ala carboxypeptidase/endopeptidase (penicillin-binding protein 4)